MLKFLFQDAIFAVAVAVQAVAGIRLATAGWNVPALPVLEPVFAAYEAWIVSPIRDVISVVFAGVASWYIDAYVLAAVLMFLFVLAQVKRASSVDGAATPLPGEKRDRVEAFFDHALPVAAAAFLSAIAALTLLPLLTPLLALVLLLRKWAGSPSWYAVSRTYYVNAVLVLTFVASVVYIRQSA
jgi:hypothetical protein